MRSTAAFLILGYTLIWGVTARAGTPAVSDPFDVAGCGETDWVGAQMGDPNAIFAGVLDCPGLCRLAEAECRKFTRLAEAECRKFTRLAYTCRLTIVGKRQTWEKRNCQTTLTDPAELKACKLQAKADAKQAKQIENDGRHAQLAACGAWSAQCQATCD